MLNGGLDLTDRMGSFDAGTGYDVAGTGFRFGLIGSVGYAF
jgi:hypothetical protein